MVSPILKSIWKSFSVGQLEWILCFGFGLIALHRIAGSLNVWANSVGVAAERKRLKTVSLSLQEIEESLTSGMVPDSGKWAALEKLPQPWGPLIFQSLTELRASGGALLPTLRRLRALAEEHQVSLMDAKAKSSQALSQAMVCSFMVPLFGGVLYFLLPGVGDHPYLWALICLGSLGIASLGSAWLLHLSSAARWGGLQNEQRCWVLASQCAGERFLALVRSGTPSDLAWTRSCELLIREAPALAVQWGSSVWAQPPVLSGTLAAAARVLVETGTALKKAVQLSLMEGRPCTERVEAALLALRQEMRSQVDRELALLATRALKPLFICVAPSILALLGAGVWLAWTEIAGTVNWNF
jgi:hypothetical protein